MRPTTEDQSAVQKNKSDQNKIQYRFKDREIEQTQVKACLFL